MTNTSEAEEAELQRTRENRAKYIGLWLFMIGSVILYALTATFFFEGLVHGPGFTWMRFIVFAMSAFFFPILFIMNLNYERALIRIPWYVTLFLTLVCTIGGATNWGGVISEDVLLLGSTVVLGYTVFLYVLFFQLYTGRSWSPFAILFKPWGKPSVMLPWKYSSYLGSWGAPVPRKYYPVFYWLSVAPTIGMIVLLNVVVVLFLTL